MRDWFTAAVVPLQPISLSRDMNAARNSPTLRLLDSPTDAETAFWAVRLLHLRDGPVPDGPETLRALREALLTDPPEPDPDVAGQPVMRDAVTWAYRVFLGRDPEGEGVVLACLSLRNLAELAANFRRAPEFLNQLAEGAPGEPPPLLSVPLTLAGAPARILGSPGDPYVQNLRATQPEAESLWKIARAVAATRPGAFEVLDVGANLGVTALALARGLPTHRVVAVEPGPGIAALLRRNLAENGAGRVEVVEAALGPTSAQVAFREDGFSAGSHIILAHADGATHQVEQTTLDDLASRLGLADLGFVKLDVEGFERGVLEAGLATLRRCRPTVHMEFNIWAQLALGDSNPRHFLDWLGGEFPHIHAADGRGGWIRYDRTALRALLHRNIVELRGIEDLVLSYDDSWAGALT